jgi:hypothetical protein
VLKVGKPNTKKDNTYMVTFSHEVEGFKFLIGDSVKSKNAPPWFGTIEGETYTVLDLSPEWHIKIQVGTRFYWIHQSHFESAK